ncbi:tol-pal system protein YbgF [Betaproteobacteria bacterium]|nr:tol-pal system protein YbgF [Betaproteobacteria bacterium]GHU42789.1 tol-pal system protein YbgF [Betaproteobacteria bacterium]
MQRLALPLLCAGALLIAPVAEAGLFDDDVARQRIIDLQTATDARVETLTQAQLELSTQLLGLREEISRLRGEIETLHYENEQAKKRLQDLYLDLDSRVTPLERGGAAGAGGAALTVDPAVENNAYEDALNQFKAGKYPAAAAAFAAFVQHYPDSDMAPNAQFWLGNAWYAQQKCKQAIDAQQIVATRWPDSARAPDALLAIANCQRDDGNTTAARRTLNNLIEKYPTSQAATQAKQRLR